MEQSTNQQPRNIFEGINLNVVALSEDLNMMHGKIDEILSKVNLVYNALFPAQGIEEEKPNAAGDNSARNNEVGSSNL